MLKKMYAKIYLQTFLLLVLKINIQRLSIPHSDVGWFTLDYEDWYYYPLHCQTIVYK